MCCRAAHWKCANSAIQLVAITLTTFDARRCQAEAYPNYRLHTKPGYAVCGNCGQAVHLSGSPRCPAKGTKCHFCQRPNHWEVMCQMKRQSQMVTESASSSQTNHIMPPQAAKSSPPFKQTVQIITCAARLVPFCAEVDTGSFCPIIDQDYLSKYLPDKPVTALRDLPCT